MKDWHRLRKSEAAAVDEKHFSSNMEDVLWQTTHRSFTVVEMKKRQVQRKTGLAILSTVKETGTASAASTLANALRGNRKSSCIVVEIEFRFLPQAAGQSFEIGRHQKNDIQLRQQIRFSENF
jgi:hypothetical protein